jgi:ubiquinone/menaquinone biosynthesis C-methylase UbiE
MNFSVFNLNKYSIEEGVYILTSVSNDFEDLYIKLRTKEKRIYSDSELKLLPFASGSNPHKNEWSLRAKSFLRYKEYLNTKKDSLNILDLGCGNGWFSGHLSKIYSNNFYCLDVNLTELKQGKRVFNYDSIKFLYADIFTTEIPRASFDIIIINAAVHYFPDLKKLFNRLLSLINENGEIHIIDSPFYQVSELANAKTRTLKYYSSIGFPEMGNNYYHHSFNQISEYNNKILYNSSSFKNRILNFLSVNDSPFLWICIKKEERLF